MKYLEPYAANQCATPKSEKIVSEYISLLVKNLMDDSKSEDYICSVVEKTRLSIVEIIHSTQKPLRELRVLLLGAGANPPFYLHYEPWLARALHYAGTDVVAVDIGNFENEPPYKAYAQCDLTEEENIKRLMKEDKFDIVTAYKLIDSPDVPPAKREILRDNVFRLAKNLLEEDSPFICFPQLEYINDMIKNCR